MKRKDHVKNSGELCMMPCWGPRQWQKSASPLSSLTKWFRTRISDCRILSAKNQDPKWVAIVLASKLDDIEWSRFVMTLSTHSHHSVVYRYIQYSGYLISWDDITQKMTIDLTTQHCGLFWGILSPQNRGGIGFQQGWCCQGRSPWHVARGLVSRLQLWKRVPYPIYSKIPCGKKMAKLFAVNMWDSGGLRGQEMVMLSLWLLCLFSLWRLWRRMSPGKRSRFDPRFGHLYA